MDSRLVAFERLLNIMDDLREKCPWDQKQTFETLRNLTIEETYELTDAITKNDMQEIKGEIGDLFLHLVFYCKLGNEQGQFDVTSVLNAICEKLIYRHPHIYGDVTVSGEEEVKANWEKLKLKEVQKKYSNVIEQVRGVGLLRGIKLKIDNNKFLDHLFQNKMLAVKAGDNVVRLLPPLIVEKKDIDEAIRIITKTCSEF